MSLKDFQNLKSSKTPEEFKEWFDNTAGWYIDVYGQKIICAKVAKRKAFLRNGMLVEADSDDEIRLVDREEWNTIKNENWMWEKYTQLGPENRYNINHLIKLSWEEEEKERERIANAYCTFCGRTKNEVDKLIIGRKNGVFICDECIKECNKILEE